MSFLPCNGWSRRMRWRIFQLSQLPFVVLVLVLLAQRENYHTLLKFVFIFIVVLFVCWFRFLFLFLCWVFTVVTSYFYFNFLRVPRFLAWWYKWIYSSSGWICSLRLWSNGGRWPDACCGFEIGSVSKRRRNIAMNTFSDNNGRYTHMGSVCS